jgi:anaerobic magnesium-protoporphyrin IX monomethyl ester cyclase
MKPKILFVYVNPLKMPYIDLGIASLSAYLKERDYRTFLIDLTFKSNIKRAIKILKRINPEIVCFSSRSGEFSDVVKIAKIFKKNQSSLYICGGVHPTLDPDDAISQECFEGICIGEGELAIHELAKNIEEKKNYRYTKNFWFKYKGNLIKNSKHKLIQDLDILPLIDYELFDIKIYLKVRNGQLDYVSARGCPFSCTYCVNHKLMEINKGLGIYSRRKSAEKIIKEIKQIILKYPLGSFKIADEHFIIDKERLSKLAHIYKKEINIPFECDVRADFCDETTIKTLKEMNCDKLNIAIETGDEILRNTLLNKKITDQEIINAFKIARKYGLHTMSFNMVGLPMETEAQIWKTINLNKKVKPDSIQVSIFTPFKGTSLYEYCKEKKLIITKKIERSYYLKSCLKNPNINPKKLRTLSKRFSYYSYKDRSLIKAYLLLLRDYSIPIYLKLGPYIPLFIKRIIYRLFWGVKPLRFISK